MPLDAPAFIFDVSGWDAECSLHNFLPKYDSPPRYAWIDWTDPVDVSGFHLYEAYSPNPFGVGNPPDYRFVVRTVYTGATASYWHSCAESSNWGVLRTYGAVGYYRWIVCGYDGHGEGPFSDPMQFVLAGTSTGPYVYPSPPPDPNGDSPPTCSPGGSASAAGGCAPNVSGHLSAGADCAQPKMQCTPCHRVGPPKYGTYAGGHSPVGQPQSSCGC